MPPIYLMSNNEIVVTSYVEHKDDPTTWKSPEPAFDLFKFNRELERRGGYFHGMARFRCRWAGNLDEYVIEDYNVRTGWVYKDDDGHEVVVPDTELNYEFPDKAVVTERRENYLIFTPRYVMEEFQEAAGADFGATYRKVWFIENIKTVKKAYGRVDVESYFREPAEIDLQMAEQLTRTRLALTPADAAAGLAALKDLYACEKARINEEFQNEMVEDTVKALTDGMPNAKQFSINPHTPNIQEYSKNLVREHNKNL